MKKLLVVIFCLLFVALSMNAEESMGLFQVCYRIGNNVPGAPIFSVNLAVYTPGKTVNGAGVIFQATNPVLKIDTKLSGDFTYMTVMPPSVSHILVVLTGGVSPTGQINVYLRMSLNEDWQSGVANYKYMDKDGVWHEMENQPVTIVLCDSIKSVKKS